MKTDEFMDKKGVMVEEWKARRKGWKKKRWKKGEKGKSGFWEKSFLVLFDCVFASPLFSLHPPHHHHNTHAHVHITQHDALVHTITCKQGRVLCCLFWEWTARHTASSTERQRERERKDCYSHTKRKAPLLV